MHMNFLMKRLGNLIQESSMPQVACALLHITRKRRQEESDPAVENVEWKCWEGELTAAIVRVEGIDELEEEEEPWLMKPLRELIESQGMMKVVEALARLSSEVVQQQDAGWQFAAPWATELSLALDRAHANLGWRQNAGSPR